MTEVFFWLLVGHCLADYPLQGSFLAAAKRRGSVGSTPWQIALFAHSMIHAGFVAWFTGSVMLGLAELALHTLIDFAKCEGWLNGAYQYSAEAKARGERTAFWIDQWLHVACKLLWVALLGGAA
jgi:hypothetical protein